MHECLAGLACRTTPIPHHPVISWRRSLRNITYIVVSDISRIAAWDLSMKQLHRFSVAVSIALALIAGELGAQEYVTNRWVYLRRVPSNTGARIRVLQPAETLSVRIADMRFGFIPVRTKDGRAGWVGESSLRNLRAEAEAAATTLVDASAPATRIDSTWEKPPIVTSTIKVKKGSGIISCGPQGKSSKPDDGTNFNKNRTDIPLTSHFITLDAIRALPDTAHWRFKGTPPFRTRWTSVDSALVIPYEGIPVTTEGYFEIVKTQSGGSGESPNCNADAERDTDWHIALVSDPSETEAQAVVVEPTPRSKRKNGGWTPEKASALAVRRFPKDKRHEAEAARVRVTGFLLFDPVHANHIGQFRATLWEIHPVTKIEVLRNGQWVNLNDITPQN
jgi:hypothetical protein